MLLDAPAPLENWARLLTYDPGSALSGGQGVRETPKRCDA
jgi:hypothetical protein